ncbi:conjugal transfer protein TraI [Mucilaginibacter endophyticus]|uniref:conjugal transfer protein TraI n=1 Tax=Mucilaginibacter endophyticus TaxID=2675003 RepID=UPI000E0DC6B4|nr:conjugal transfer protein TraI [Mucilaginibacter endophyticus]
MKRHIIILVAGMLYLTATPEAKAQVPAASAFTGLIKKVIVAIDIKVQRLQNQTIALQNAEQQVENTLHLNSLNGIADWLTKEKDLYAGYYRELSKVRRLIVDYDAVKRIISQQSQVLSEYRNANALFRRDPHFSPTELKYMGNIYSGILQESLRNLDETITVISDLAAQMDDAERLERISLAAKAMQTNLDHLRQFNRQNAALSFQRAKDGRDRAAVKQFYGIQ